MQTIHKKWLDHFKREIKDTSVIRIVSPFVSETMVKHLLENAKGREIHFITRFNLNDFSSKVSSLSALERLLNEGGKIIGIKGLHSKAYIFDNKSAIITSANFTSGGFFNNYEFGVITTDNHEVQDAIDYFDELWKIGDNNFLSYELIKNWKDEIEETKTSPTKPAFNDYGVSIVDKITKKRKYFVKFYGTGDERASLSVSTKDMVAETHCHFAVTFPKGNGRPRRYQEGDVVFIARMVEGQDYAIFGKAIARSHVDHRDIASQEDIVEVDWKEYYPIYIRVHSGEFLDTTFENCPKLQQLMSELKGECFESTKYRFLSGNIEINPKLSLRRRPDIELSEEGAVWLEQEFEDAKNKYSLLSQSFLDSLYQGSPKV